MTHYSFVLLTSSCRWKALSFGRRLELCSKSSPMRKRRALKPHPTRRSSQQPQRTTSLLSDISRRPAVLAIFFITVTAIGLLAIRSQRRESGLKSILPWNNGPRKIGSKDDGVSNMAPVVSANVIAEYDHDKDAFTQGLIWHEGWLYESTGLQGRSSLRRVDLESGEVRKAHDLKYIDFGEGLSLSGANRNELVQVLWKVGKGYVYDMETMKPVSEFHFEGDAWGLTQVPSSSNEMYLSDGSSRIYRYRLEGNNLTKLGEFTVRDGEKEVGLLNELEMIDGEIWANVWMCDFVARIDPQTGLVNSWVDLRDLLSQSDVPDGHQVDVLNGIAWDMTQRRIFVTGKLWPKLYSIQVTEEVVAKKITQVTNGFFLDPARVRYVHKHMLA